MVKRTLIALNVVTVYVTSALLKEIFFIYNADKDYYISIKNFFNRQPKSYSKRVWKVRIWLKVFAKKHRVMLIELEGKHCRFGSKQGTYNIADLV